MPRKALKAKEVKDMLIHVADGIAADVEVLTEADRMGDGDHGESMARGFADAREKLESADAENVQSLFNTVGMSLMMKAGGAAGAVFGSMFRGGSKSIGDAADFDSRALSQFLRGGLEAVKQRGKSDVGQKTMIDALEPASREAEALKGAPLDEALKTASEAAEAGMERTKEMKATVGKAKTLGERSKGHPDPGAVSVDLILKYMNEYVTKR